MGRGTASSWARRAAGVAVVAAACALFAVPAHATFRGANGAFAAQFREIDRGGDDDRDIQVFGATGGVLASLSPCSRPETGSPSGTCAANPSFSPSGNRIAFDRQGRLALANADGTGLQTLDAFTARDEDPAFSPNGNQLVFTGVGSGRRNLFTVNVGGTGLRQLTRAGGKFPTWSSEGRIAYYADGNVWRLNPANPRRVRVARGSRPDWSPSGAFITYQRLGDAYRVLARSGAARILLRRNAQRPTYSPDAKRIAFERPIPIGGNDSIGSSIYTVASRDGTGLRLLRRGGETPVGSTFDFFTRVAWQPRP